MIGEKVSNEVDRVALALELEHPFTPPAKIPLDFKYATEKSALDPEACNGFRWKQMQRLKTLAERTESLVQN